MNPFLLFWLAFIFATQFAVSSELSKHDKPSICFFEMGNTGTSDNFKKQSTIASAYTFSPKGKKPLTAFKNMIESGKKCDSLVFSGHHTGDWHGDGKALKLKDLEELSCNPKYKSWFENIKALWLDGCNTVTDNAIQSSSPPTVDSESVRVIEKEFKREETARQKKNRFVSMSQSYAGSLDKNTSLSSRYLRMFPKTQIYGFNGAAPSADDPEDGDQTFGQSYIFNHLSLLAQALDAEELAQVGNNDLSDFEKGLNAMFLGLCDEKRMEAWEGATKKQADTEAIENQDYRDAYNLGCDLILAKQLLDDPSSKPAQEALANKFCPELKEDELQCTEERLNLANRILDSSLTSQEHQKLGEELAKKIINKTLTTIIKEDQNITEEKLKYSHLLFNNIYDTWNVAKKYKGKDKGFFNSVRRKLKSGSFKDSLKNRISSSDSSSLKKVDYIKFYSEVQGKGPPFKGKEAFIQDEIDLLVLKANCSFSHSKSGPCSGIKTLRSPRKRDLDPEIKKALSLSLIDQLMQYDFLSPKQKRELLNNEELLSPDSQDNFALSVRMQLEVSNGGQERLLSDIQDAEGKGETYRLTALSALSKNYFRNAFSALSKNDLKQEDISQLDFILSDMVNPRSENAMNSYGKVVWNEMHYELKRKSPQDRIDFVSFVINNPKVGEYTRGFFSQYVANKLSDSEKQEVCNKITDQRSFYKTEVIQCP